MQPARFYHFLLPALATLLACACALFGVAVTQSWRERDAFAARETAARAQLAELQASNARQQAELNDLLDNPVALERAVRERLGYSRKGELVFKFER